MQRPDPRLAHPSCRGSSSPKPVALEIQELEAIAKAARVGAIDKIARRASPSRFGLLDPPPSPEEAKRQWRCNRPSGRCDEDQNRKANVVCHSASRGATSHTRASSDE